MTKKRRIYQISIALLLCLMQTAGIAMYGQSRPRAAAKRIHRLQADSLAAVRQAARMQADSLNRTMEEVPPLQAVVPADSIATADSIAAENKKKLLEMTSAPVLKESEVPADSLKKEIDQKIWVPNPTKATWLALVIPGGGQIYNRKYWKLPIFYGGFAGCAYALTWNSKMYKDYSTAYKDAMNGNMQSSSITDLLPPGYKISETQLKELLRKRKDTYRRYRDLSIFAFIGVYLLSVIDAYVDAELSNFDITPDLSMKVEPAVIDNRIDNSSNRSVGLQCSFRF
ncbi:hypothetical protein DWX40_10995 [Bacteroides stercoris]|jgi:hypothetical protein|uniref:DUF5683 domain-containing protein n=1 Tax=Bacteroides stercoris TaxID=46506 RepID=A0A7J5KZH0_BACSE|nr:DUF5683 domain-containing protein [Bacteroides stercoris]KAB5259835.1 hypothetical protein F9966_15140 [Bacteroides stercoris]KAB5259909.1 hypothetical protein F9968_15605 [Bacteroides stercoris]KAB5279527.1 hypothetical protein F9962_15555 [Bacteroides stercoris]KAB5281873.1 hypothetical protein F9957_15340 [Bacteroides stercoris]KAB5289313.1 hypothetical protein F9959_15210 [Bacteroides stercoris]